MGSSDQPIHIFIREALVEDAADMAKVHVDTWRTTYGGIVPDDFLANLRYERSQARWLEYLTTQQASRSFVAQMQAGKIVGITTGGAIREAVGDFDGELYGLYLLKAYQGLGIGRKLMVRVAHYLQSEGYRSMMLWVLKENPSCRFYEHLGGKVCADRTIELGGKMLDELGYGWNDLPLR